MPFPFWRHSETNCSCFQFPAASRRRMPFPVSAWFLPKGVSGARPTTRPVKQPTPATKQAQKQAKVQAQNLPAPDEGENKKERMEIMVARTIAGTVSSGQKPPPIIPPFSVQSAHCMCSRLECRDGPMPWPQYWPTRPSTTCTILGPYPKSTCSVTPGTLSLSRTLQKHVRCQFLIQCLPQALLFDIFSVSPAWGSPPACLCQADERLL